MKGQEDIFDPRRWGLPRRAVKQLGKRLHACWERYRPKLKTKTRDTSENGLTYIRGLLTMNSKRNFANIARCVNGVEDDGQALHQFMSNSPWAAQGVFDQIQTDIGQERGLAGGALLLDEVSDEKAGTGSAGTARQYLGCRGKVELGQVGVMLGYAKDQTWLLVDAALHLPEVWFDAAQADACRACGIPKSLRYETLNTQGLKLIGQAQRNHLPFRFVACDGNYGRDSLFRAELDARNLRYIADVPISQTVYLTRPEVGVPPTPAGHRGPHFSQPGVLNQAVPYPVKDLVTQGFFTLQSLPIRHTERGPLMTTCAALRVWTITSDDRVREEWLLVQQDTQGDWRLSLSNFPPDTPLTQLTSDQHQRYFVERTFQDAKSETGWDEFQARSYPAWLHHTALDALALWFIAQTKLDWQRTYHRDPKLKRQLKVAQLPNLSLANVRLMLQAVLPLPQLSVDQATQLVVKHLVHRAASTRSRSSPQV